MRTLQSFGLLLVIAVLLCTADPGVSVEPASDPAREIECLLSYIEHSGCTFVRNGTDHTPEEAAEHIRKKYDYLADRVKTAEEFIRYAATGSSLSGRPYTVRCDGTEQLTADWLGAELLRMRGADDSPQL